MRPVIQHAARFLAEHTTLTRTAARNPSLCIQSHFRSFSSTSPARHKRPTQPESPYLALAIRQWSSTVRALKDRLDSTDPDRRPLNSDPQTPAIEDAARRVSEPAGQEPPSLPQAPDPRFSFPDSEPPPTAPASPAPSSESNRPPVQSDPEPSVTRVPDEKLPSHREGLKWKLYNRISAYVEEILPSLLAVGQKVNNYTGTDYSGIQALKQEIHDQERLVKARRAVVDAAKAELESALAQQTSSQKEVVGLLERKHSWSAADLERYMSLIRSEHLNEQAVRQAKDKVRDAERSLEESRAQLEKRERAQYHEEQIWSDTIRRNSTWVTFGLMGVNILLLMSQLFVFEPWRRRRLVREIKAALDERTLTAAAPVPAAVAAAAPAEVGPVASAPEPVRAAEPEPAPAESADTASAAVEKEIDAVIEPAGVSLETVEEKAPPPDNLVTADLSGPEPTIPLPSTSLPTAAEKQEPTSFAPPPPPPRPAPESARERFEYFAQDCERWVRDLFSERAVSVRKVDVTAAALQGAVAGAAVMGVVLVAVLGVGGGGGGVGGL